MCGIAGALAFNESAALLPQMEKANQRQESRGPDGAGIYQLDQLAFGHRRLKIYDLSDRAAQPMIDHALGLALVFNGAIYNFPELRAELEAKGYSFYSEGDTEVLLKAFHAWGEACVEKLHGMFAFAVWDIHSNKLTIARDRLGIKPLYYTHTNEGFRFASTLPALLEFDGVDTRIDPEGLHYYLTFHAVPEPTTILRGVRKLPPGHILTIGSDGDMNMRRYWTLCFGDHPHIRQSDAQWQIDTQNALVQAVNRQLSADVPVGILLSGGLDSSLLVALAHQQHGQEIETFSIGFESAGEEKGDEFYYSDIVAKHFQTKHHQMFISNKRLVDSLAECVRSMSEPMTSHDNIGFYLLSQEVSRHVKVVLSGQGADEIFAGYHWFQPIADQQVNADQAAQAILSRIGDNSYAEYAQMVSHDYLADNAALHFLKRMSARNPSPCLLNHMLDYESNFALANGPLGRVDNMTMASSLEARVPFLDEIVVDAATHMPNHLKIDDGGKGILKQIGRSMLPSEIVDRPKGYFPVPALKHVHGATLDFMRDILSANSVKRRGIFNPSQVAAMLEKPEDHITPTGASKLWQLALLEYWLEQQGI